MNDIIPNLLEGKILTGVLPPDKQLPVQYLLPPQLNEQRKEQEELLDIESCIDDPSLAPLGLHIQQKKKRKSRKHDNNSHSSGQVSIQRQKQQGNTTNTNNGIIMLRRRGLNTQQLSTELSHLLSIDNNTPPSPPSSPKTQHLFHNYYLRLPTTIQHITELDLSKNKLTQLPTEIQQLNNLKILNLTCNEFHSVPKEIYSLKQLQVLSLSQNKIKVIPTELPDELSNLVTLKIAANLIQLLPTNLSKWTQLQQLQLGSVYGGNKLTSLSNTIIDLPSLQELDVSNNQLKSLPSQFIIPKLKFLNLSNNQLASIPKSIASCQELKSLNLSKNHLASLPIDLVNLKKLELFDISENLLCIMPEELLNKMDSALLITGNPLTRPAMNDNGQDEYTKLLRQMTLRSVTRGSSVITPSSSSSSSSSGSSSASSGNSAATGYFDQCGPRGMGCLSPLPSSPLISPRNQIKKEEEEEDEDALIDHELSFHAQQLNINGSRPSTPITVSPRLQPTYQPSPLQSPPILATAVTRAIASIDVEESTATTNTNNEEEEEQHNVFNTFRSNLIPLPIQHQQPQDQQCIMVEFPRQLPLPTETKLLHSLKEIATRTLVASLSQEEEEELLEDILPEHLIQDVQNGKTKSCSYCQGPFIHEWVTSVQVKSFGGHPAVVRRVRFCSTKCWTWNLPQEQEGKSKSVICVHK